MMLLPEHIKVTAHPPQPTTGMLTGTQSKGIRVVHEPTGCAVECVKFRSQPKNIEVALAILELLVEA